MEMNIPPASSLISFETQHKDSENSRYSGKYFADKLPPLQKPKNGKKVASTPIIQVPLRLTKKQGIKPLKKFQDEFYIRIPEGLIPWLNEVETDPLLPRGLKITQIKYFLHLVASRIGEDGLSYLKKEYLRPIIRRINDLIAYLESQGIIERPTGFKRGFHSCGYEIKEPYRGKCIKVPLGDPRLLWKIRKQYAKENEKEENTRYPKQCKLIESMIIDPEAEKFADNTYEGKDLEYALSAINNIQNKIWVHTVDDTGERFHSNITNLPRELRKFVRVKGKPLVANCDIKNSQPVFSIMLLTDPKKCMPFVKSKNLYKTLKRLHIPDNEDVRLYKKLTLSGELYEFLWDKFYQRGIIFQEMKPNGKRGDRRYKIPDRIEITDKYKRHEIRQDIKTMVYRILYDRNREKPSKAKQIFIEFFPTVDEIFCKVRGNDRCENRFENYKRFSILLQNLESHVILKMILKRVYREGFTAIVDQGSALTVHDSLLVTDNAERIAEIMAEELQKFMGFLPKIEIESL